MRQYAASITEETVTVCDGDIRTFTGKSGEEEVYVDGKTEWPTLDEAIAAVRKWADAEGREVATADNGMESITYKVASVFSYDEDYEGDEDEDIQNHGEVRTVSDEELEAFKRRIIEVDAGLDRIVWDMESE